MRTLLSIGMGLSLWTAALARADQCEVVTPAQAQAALAALPHGVRYFEFCEPCGDPHPGEIRVVGHARKKPWSEPPDQVIEIDGQEIDLAYVFVADALTSATKFVNLAWLAHCPAEGVSHLIDPQRPPVPQRLPVQQGGPDSDPPIGVLPETCSNGDGGHPCAPPQRN
jgi:hypothetical protein